MMPNTAATTEPPLHEETIVVIIFDTNSYRQWRIVAGYTAILNKLAPHGY